MLCDVCRFDSSAWSETDLRRTLDAVPTWFAHLQEGASDAVLTALAPHTAQLAVLPRGVADADAVHTAWHLLADAGRVRHRRTPPASGTVVQVSTSSGGVPKLPVRQADVTAAGLEGDAQGDRTHHGRPWQAVCLWSAEVVADLVAQGHPVGWGSTGGTSRVYARVLVDGTVAPGDAVLLEPVAALLPQQAVRAAAPSPSSR